MNRQAQMYLYAAFLTDNDQELKQAAISSSAHPAWQEVMQRNVNQLARYFDEQWLESENFKQYAKSQDA